MYAHVLIFRLDGKYMVRINDYSDNGKTRLLSGYNSLQQIRDDFDRPSPSEIVFYGSNNPYEWVPLNSDDAWVRFALS